MTRAAAPILGGLVVLGLAWLLWGGDDEGSDQPSRPERPAPARTLPAHDAGAEPDSEVLTPIETAAYQEGEAAAYAAMASNSHFDPRHNVDTQQVLVIDDQGRPISGAEVLVVPSGFWSRVRLSEAGRAAPAPRFPSALTDEAGRITLFGPFAPRYDIHAQTATAFGRSSTQAPAPQIDDEENEVVVRLRPSVALSITVKYPNGEPAAATPVVVSDGRRSLEFLTDANGIVLSRIVSHDRLKLDRALTAKVKDGFSEPVASALEDGYHFDLVAPGVGELRMLILDPESDAPVDGATVDAYPLQHPPVAHRFHATNGRLTLGGLGSQDVVLTITGSDRTAAIVRLPTQPPGQTEVAVFAGMRHANVVLPIVIDDLQPLAATKLKVTVQYDDGPGGPARFGLDDAAGLKCWAKIYKLDPFRPQSFNLTTDNDGYIRGSIRAAAPGALTVTLPAALNPRLADGQLPPPLVTIPLAPLPSGTQVLPTVTLPSFRTLAAGRVVNSEGAPVANAQVSIEAQVEQEKPGAPRLLVAADVSGPDGSFVVLGPVIKTQIPVTVAAKHKNSASEPRLITVGEQDLRVELFAQGSISGRLTLASPTLRGQAQFRVAKSNGTVIQGGTTLKQEKDGSVSFKTTRLLPGTYSVSISLFGITEREAHGIEVLEGQVVTPPSLQGGVLGTGYAEGRVTVVDEVGRPLKNVQLRLRDDGTPRANFPRIRTGTDGTALLPYRPHHAPRLDVSGPGWTRRYSQVRFPLVVEPPAEYVAQKQNAGPPSEVQSTRFRFQDTIPQLRGVSRLELVVSGGVEQKTVTTQLTGKPQNATFKSLGRGKFDTSLRLTFQNRGIPPAIVPVGRYSLTGRPDETVQLPVPSAALEAALPP